MGGIPEILPDEMITLCEPSISDLIEKLEFAIARVRSGNHMDPYKMHNDIKDMYNWRNVAKRTEIVYNRVADIKSSNTLFDILMR